MKQLYYVRHGESEDNKAKRWSGRVDPPLTMKGHGQAMRTGRHAQRHGLTFDVIISSPLERAHKTAEHIATRIGYPHKDIVLHPGFVERGFGKLEHQRSRTIRLRYLLKGDKAFDKYEGVETLADLDRRAEDMLAYLHSLPYDNILVVAHGSFGRAMQRAVNKETPSYRAERLNNAQIIRLI